MARIVFFCHNDPATLRTFEYYNQDIEALEALGHEVVVCSRYREIPRHYDAMFVWWWTHALYPIVRARLSRKPSLVTGVYNFRFPAGFNGTDYFRRPAWQRALLRLATTLPDLNLFIDQGELRSCTEYFHLDNARSFPCVINEDYLQGPLPQRELALFNLAWSGRQNLERKGIPDLLDAIHILRTQGVPVRLYLAGHRGDGTDWMLARISELGIDDAVSWLGPLSREEKIQRLRTCEIYVQPSHYEGFGLATAEAMGAGACIVTCDVGMVRTVVGDCGLYVTPGNPDQLAQTIRRALEDETLRRRMQQAAHERARTEFRAAEKREKLRRYLAEVGITSR